MKKSRKQNPEARIELYENGYLLTVDAWGFNSKKYVSHDLSDILKMLEKYFLKQKEQK